MIFKDVTIITLKWSFFGPFFRIMKKMKCRKMKSLKKGKNFEEGILLMKLLNLNAVQIMIPKGRKTRQKHLLHLYVMFLTNNLKI